MAGASWVQKNILEPNPEADIDVAAVWFNVLPSDSQDNFDPALLTDARVTQYWDADGDIGTWFEDHEDVIGFSSNTGTFVWDAYLLFGPDATWENTPEPLALYGRTVLAAKDELLAEVTDIWSSLP